MTVQPSEAGFSTNLYLNNEKSGRVQFTFRGATSDAWGDVMADVHKFLEEMHNKGWMLDGEWREAHGQPPAPVQSTEPPAGPPAHHVPAAGSSGKRYESVPCKPEDLPPDLPTNSAEGGPYEYFMVEFDWAVITPEVDDKATVKFFQEGSEYPVGAPINKWKHKQVASMLTALGEIDPSKATKLTVPGIQYWKPGNKYTDKKTGQERHYKDLCAVEKR